jgi:hypothetical protein
MKYSCDHCSYETDKKANYLRHINRKFKFNKKVDAYYKKVDIDYKKVDIDYKKVDVDYKKVDVCHKKVDVCHKKVDVCHKKVYDYFKEVDVGNESVLINNKFKCLNCNKVFSTKHGLDYHASICNGLSKLQCEICCKFFSSKYGKYQHKRNVLCYPPPPPPENESPDNLLIVKESETIVPTMNHSQNNSQNTTNSNNNTVNNNIINFNSFGDEGIEQLGEYLTGRKYDSKIIERMRQLGKKKIYGIREIQNDIFFNPDNPEGFSIIKPEKYGSSVRVRNSEGEFEYMEFADVRDPLLDYIEKYIDIYNKTRNKYNVKFRDPKERRILQNFFKIMNDDLDIYLKEDLKQDLNISDNSSEKSEDIRYKQFDKVSLDNIHVQTKKYYKCKNGDFQLK